MTSKHIKTPKHLKTSQRSASPPIWQITVGVLGLILIFWAVFSLRLITPPQDDTVCSPTTADVAPSNAEDFATDVDGVPVAAETLVLYPEHPALGDSIGTITLPTLNLSWPIFEGTTEEQLSQGVGHFVGSVLPGVRDNSVLSGHRNTVFGTLGDLELGDDILVSTSAGIFTYEVREFQIVEKSSLEVIVPTETAVLTLTTCYPFVTPFPTTQAFIVSADLVNSSLTRTP